MWIKDFLKDYKLMIRIVILVKLTRDISRVVFVPFDLIRAELYGDAGRYFIYILLILIPATLFLKSLLDNIGHRLN